MRQVKRAELSKSVPLPAATHVLTPYTSGDYSMLDGLTIGNWAGRIFEVVETGGQHSTIIYIHNVGPSLAFVREPK